MKINYISIKPLTDEDVLKISCGEVKKSETMSYRNLEPEPDGLFCQKIFGPLVDYTCACRKKTKKKKVEKKCSVCGVSYIKSSSRRERFGHISLNCPLIHIWFLKSLPSKLGLILNLNSKKLSDIIYFKKYVVIFSKIKSIKKMQLLSESDYLDLPFKYVNNIDVLTGAEAIEYLLAFFSIDKELKKIKKKLKTKFTNKNFLRLKFLLRFKKNNFNVRNLIIRNIPVIPADLRPLVNIGKNKFISSDLNELYKRIIISNNRLKKLYSIKAPEFVITSEKKILQNSLDSLFDNKKNSKFNKNYRNVTLKSLSENLKGKRGRFRFNLLGKRVDFSGRSVIVVDPKIKFGFCGIPYNMAIELFKPFILGFLKKERASIDIRFSLNIIFKKKKKIKKILNKIVKKYTVILNRAPTLHRLNIQSFYAKIIDEKAIKIHPLICSAYNADFDGDQMSVHIPLSPESIIESKKILFSKKNFISPSSGNISIPLTQESSLGIYLLTKRKIDKLKKIKFFSSFSNVVCYSYTIDDLSEEIYVRFNNIYINTTVGRVLVFNLIPDKSMFLKYNKVLDKKLINKITYKVYLKYGTKIAQKTIIKLMDIGFKYVTQSGISISSSDIRVCNKKKKIVSIYKNFFENNIVNNSNLSHVEKKSISIDLWRNLCLKINLMVKKKNKYKKCFFYDRNYIVRSNSNLYDIVKSGSKGTESQMYQINGMRGLVTVDGIKIINFPIISNLKEGMNSYEYFVSTYGARKGLIDTSLKTADSGYLTRRLVDVSQDLVINSVNCFSKKGIILNNKNILCSKYVGRCLARNFYSKNGKLILKAGSLINHEFIKKFKKIGGYIVVRSPVFCKSKFGLCSFCYGTDIISSNLISLGESAGVIAAQSIGEPGTQLTMRTFHTGGIITNFLKKKKKIIKNKGFIKFSSNLRIIKYKGKTFSANHGIIYLLSISGKILLKKKIFPFCDISKYKNNRFSNSEINSSTLRNEEGFNISKSFISGFYNIENLSKCLYKEYVYSNFSIIKFDYIPIKKKVYIYIKNKKKSYIVNINKNDLVVLYKNKFIKKGYILKVNNYEKKNYFDITNSLIKISNIFENRDTNFNKKYYRRNFVVLNEKFKNFFSNWNRKGNIILNKGYKNSFSPFNKKIILKGHCKKICSSSQFLQIFGIEKFVKHFTYNVYKVYNEHNINLDFKHIEVILSRMLTYAIVLRSNNKNYLGKKICIRNKKNYKRSFFINIIEGITSVSLKSRSFISSASFQNTIKVLLESAFKFKKDNLRGIKENVIIGKRIPAGTGFLERE